MEASLVCLYCQLLQEMPPKVQSGSRKNRRNIATVPSVFHPPFDTRLCTSTCRCRSNTGARTQIQVPIGVAVVAAVAAGAATIGKGGVVGGLDLFQTATCLFCCPFIFF